MKWIVILFCSTSMTLCQTTPKKHHHVHPSPKKHSVAKKNAKPDEDDPAIQAIIDSLREREY